MRNYPAAARHPSEPTPPSPLDSEAQSTVLSPQVNAGKFFADQLGERIKAEKTLVQKSGYFARSAAPNDEVRGHRSARERGP